jgi:hypothetical protein
MGRRDPCDIDKGGLECGALFDSHQNLGGSPRTLPLQEIANESTSQRIGAILGAAVALKEAIKFIEAGTRPNHELVQKLTLILESPSAFSRHRKTLVKPSWDHAATGSAPNQHMRDLMPQHVLKRGVRIAGRACRENDNQLR